MKNRIFSIYFLLFIISVPVFSQKKLLSPEAFLGYELGTHFTPHHKVIEYFNHVAESASNVDVETYGKTYENRPLMVAYISSSKNMKGLQQLKEDNLKRTGLLKGGVQGEKTAILWLSYNVHGNEAVSTEASMATIYALANPENKEYQEWLNNTVVIIDPCLNPDGRDRYVNWYNQVANLLPDPNPDGMEHQEPWPGGRANHYLFDLNRDWAWLTQVESQKRIELYNQWMPHVHVDFHEQGIDAPYYFAPAAEPVHEMITAWQREFQVLIGKNNAKHFDKNNWLYFTKEVFDLFYPSYGDTYPLYNGAIGMTYEQGGSGKAGLSVLTSEGDTLSLKNRLEHHYTSGLSTLEAVSNNSEKLVSEFEAFYLKAGSQPAGTYKSFIVKNDNHPDKLKELTKWLDAHKIVYGSTEGKGRIKGFNYHTGKDESFSLENHDLVISAFQPKSVFLQVLFEPASKLPDSITYDITAWSVPYLYDLNAYASKEKLFINKPFTISKFEQQEAKGKPYAYIATKESLKDVKFLSALLNKKIKVRYSEEDFNVDGNSFKAGTLIITRRGNEKLGDSFDKIVMELANNHEKNIISVYTGFVTSGKDFGSGSVVYIKPPKVAVVAGEQVSSLAFGEVWHYFERQIEYPLSVLKLNTLPKVKINNFDVLIFPNGNYMSLDSMSIEKISAWVKGGGKLILMENAVKAFAGKEGFGLSANKENLEEMLVSAKELETKDYKDRERVSISDLIPGAIYKIRLDNSHPMAFGYGTRYYTLKNSTNTYSFLKDGWNVGTINSGNAHVSGFSGANIKTKLQGTLVFGVEGHEEGKVIYMIDNPLFRAFWYNGKLIFGNALFY